MVQLQRMLYFCTQWKMKMILTIRTYQYATSTNERCDFLYEVSVIFWDEFISNDRILIEAVLQEFKMRWSTPRFYMFVCAGDFAQVCIYLRLNLLSFNTLHLTIKTYAKL